jgi:hypothetical protein
MDSRVSASSGIAFLSDPSSRSGLIQDDSWAGCRRAKCAPLVAWLLIALWSCLSKEWAGVLTTKRSPAVSVVLSSAQVNWCLGTGNPGVGLRHGTTREMTRGLTKSKASRKFGQDVMEWSTHSSPRECKYHGVTDEKWDESQSNYREVACWVRKSGDDGRKLR